MRVKRVQIPVDSMDTRYYCRATVLTNSLPRTHALRCRLTASTLAAIVLGCGCGDDDVGSQRTGPSGPPEIRIVELRPAGANPWRPDVDSGCVPRGRDGAGTLTVVLNDSGRLENFTLRPPRGCTQALQCGFVQLSVYELSSGESLDDDVEETLIYQVAAASTTIAVPFNALPPGNAVTPRYVIRAELRDETGKPETNDAGVAYADSVTVSLCAAVQPGGRDAGVDAMQDGGFSRDGGAVVGDASRTDATSARDAESGADGAGSPRDADSGESSDASIDAPPTLDAAASSDAKLDAGADAALAADAPNDAHSSASD